MNVLLLYQDDRKGADTTAALLSAAGHAPRCTNAATVLDGSTGAESADVVIVFAEIYKEKETFSVCERLRKIVMLRDTPLLVAVNMYQMPLANRVKAMPNAHFIFAPIDVDDLQCRLGVLSGNADRQQAQ